MNYTSFEFNEEESAADLGDSEFYLNQTLYEEAKNIYLKILEASPGEERAVARLKEIETLR